MVHSVVDDTVRLFGTVKNSSSAVYNIIIDFALSLEISTV